MSDFFRNFAAFFIVIINKYDTIMPNIPTVTKNLLFINVLLFLATQVLSSISGTDLTSLLGLHFFMASDFRVYQLVTYMFMHGGWAHIILNMLMLWMFGSSVENVFGAKRYLFYYILCGIGAGLCQELAQYVQYCTDGLADYQMVNLGSMVIPTSQYLNMMTTVGASGAIYALLLAYGMMFPNVRMFIMPIPVPIKAKWVIMGSIIIEFFSGMRTGTNDNVAHMAHLGGMIFGLLLILYWRRQALGGNQRPKSRFVFGTRNHRQAAQPRKENTATGNPDWDYNADKQATQEEIDRILDKIRKSGYDSLTKSEKQRLFDQSKK